jgi:hypothetical protein
MPGTHITCTKCGSVASIISIEGEWNPLHGQSARMVAKIDCPQCRVREQPEMSNQSLQESQRQ